MYKIVDIVRYRAVQHKAVIASGIITNVFIIVSVLSAFPWVRNTYHNVFEKHHRFIGWLGLAVGILSRYAVTITKDIKRGEWRSDTHALISSQELWFAAFMTILYVTPKAVRDFCQSY